MFQEKLIARLVTLPLAALLALPAACGRAPRPRALTDEQLAKIAIEGGVARWLPIRFSAEVRNDTPVLEIVELEFEVAGMRRTVPARIAPLGERRIRFQYVFPEDPAWDGPLPADAPWSLLGAGGIAARAPGAR